MSISDIVSRKFRNVRANARVAIVVDDIASVQPLRVRCLQSAAMGRRLPDPDDSAATVPGAIICIHPRRIISWGIDPPGTSQGRRSVSP